MQLGIIESSSTTQHLVSLPDYIYQYPEKKTAVTLAFVVFTKTFDLVSYTLIFEKAVKLGMRPCLAQGFGCQIS